MQMRKYPLCCEYNPHPCIQQHHEKLKQVKFKKYILFGFDRPSHRFLIKKNGEDTNKCSNYMVLSPVQVCETHGE